MRDELYYWPSIQGRDEFVRLAPEDADAEYVDVARRKDRGVPAMTRLMKSDGAGRPPIALHDRGVSRLEASAALQRARDLPALPRVGCLNRDAWCCATRCFD